MSGKKEEYGIKTIKYELKLIFKKKIAIGCGNWRLIEETLMDMIKSGELLDVAKDEFFGIVVEEQGERDCPGNCDNCPYLCPKDEDCMMDDLEDLSDIEDLNDLADVSGVADVEDIEDEYLEETETEEPVIGDTTAQPAVVDAETYAILEQLLESIDSDLTVEELLKLEAKTK